MFVLLSRTGIRGVASGATAPDSIKIIRRFICFCCWHFWGGLNEMPPKSSKNIKINWFSCQGDQHILLWFWFCFYLPLSFIDASVNLASVCNCFLYKIKTWFFVCFLYCFLILIFVSSLRLDYPFPSKNIIPTQPAQPAQPACPAQPAQPSQPASPHESASKPQFLDSSWIV